MKLLTLLVYGLAAALIAACSPATQQSPDAPAASGSAASGTRMVKDSSGNDVEIPAEVTKVAPTIGAFSAVTAMLGASNKIVAAATSALSPRFKATYPDYEKANPNGYDTKNVRPFTLGSCDGIQDRSTSRNQIFHYDHLLTLWYTAFDLVSCSVVFWFATDIGKRQIHLVSDDSPVRNTCCCRTRDHFHIRKFRTNLFNKAIFNQSPSFWVGQSHSVICVNR